MRGFTLIEVVIAFAILGLSLATLYGAFATALSRARRDAQFSEATMIAQSLLARSGSEFAAEQTHYRGEWNGYGYQLSQEIVSPGKGQATLALPTLHASARVSWTGSNGPRQIEMSALKLVWKAQP